MAHSSGASRIFRAPSAALANGFGVAVAASLVGLDLVIPDPIVLPWRHAFNAALVAAGLCACVVALRAGRRWMALLFAAGAALAVWQGASPWLDRSLVLGRGGSDAILVGYDNVAAVRELVREARVGGVFLTRRNVAGRTIAEVAAEIAGLQAIRREAGLPALVVAADQEGGSVSHLSPPLPYPPALSGIAALPANERREAAQRLGADEGAALRTIGVTMDLAPVSDLTPVKAPGALDWNTRIATRSISGDPAIVATIAAGFSEGLLAAGVTPTAKHFPGLGRVATDTHLFGASLDAAEADLSATDWTPFRAVLGISGAAVMLSHVALESVDAGVPASRSRRIVAGVLRGQWRFPGIAITDDLSMGAVEHAGLCRAVEGALTAGIDLLLVSWDVEKAYPALRCALMALDAGRLDPAMLRESARRLDDFEGGKGAERASWRPQ